MPPTRTTSKKPPVRLVIADDHPIFRDGLRRLLEVEQDFKVVGEASNGEEAIRLIKDLDPDILLLDNAMPRMGGLATLGKLAESESPVRVIVLTAGIERADILKGLQLGARGFILKESATQLLFESIRAVMNGQYWVGRESVSDLIRLLRDLSQAPEKTARSQNFNLTARELEVVAAIVAGSSNKDIAQTFSLSEQTVKHHLTHIFDKLGVSSRLELALFAVEHGLGESRRRPA
jgi:DNA-binding NarL/FixJ family response regulator